MYDRTDSDYRHPTVELIRSLPDEKLSEVVACVNGSITECPECGELTAFPSRPTYNDESKCHNCDHWE